MSRKIDHIPTVYQKMDDTCIYCSITWIQQYLELGTQLNLDYLVEQGKGSKNPAVILHRALKGGFIKGYEVIETLNKKNLIQSLKEDPIMIGVADYLGSGAHMMAGVDVSEDGKSVKCVNWFNKNKQEITYVPFNEINYACKILRQEKSMKILDKIKSTLAGLPKKAKIGAGIGALVLALVGGYSALPNQEYGSAGVVANYSTTISGSGISDSDTSIPVASVTLYTGETFTSSDLVFPIYLMINPKGSTRELVECWGLTSLTWTSCVRGMSAKGGNTTSTVSGAAYPHNSGEAVIMTDAPYFFNRFVDRSTDQTISGEKTIADSLFSFGDGTGQIVWNGTNMGWSDNDGTDTYTFVAGGSGLSASSTKGITITDSKILINASSTYGLAFDSGGKLYINASTTDSNTGGFLNFTGNKIYWDYPALIAKDNTWTGEQTFSVTTTFSAEADISSDNLQITGTADSANDAVNYNTLNMRILEGSATGTAKLAVTEGRAIWVSSTSTLAHTSTAAASSTFQFVGIALNSAAVGAEVRYARPGETACGLSGLVPGMNYYLNGTAGEISTTPGTYFARIGRASSATCLLVIQPQFIISGSQSIASATTFTQTTGFYPVKIRIWAVYSTAGGANYGSSIGDETNSCMTISTGSGGVTYQSDLAWYIYQHAGAGSPRVDNAGTISSRTASGFVLTCSTYAETGTVYWQAQNF